MNNQKRITSNHKRIQGREVIYTAHLSTSRRPGAVLRVSNIYAGCAAFAIAWKEKHYDLSLANENNYRKYASSLHSKLSVL